jgi:hypothetical protein
MEDRCCEGFNHVTEVHVTEVHVTEVHVTEVRLQKSAVA